MNQTNNIEQTSVVDYRITLGETWIIKAVAIIAMLVHHLFLDHPEFGDSIVRIGLAGKVCITLFVFLSGYGMAASFPKMGSKRFDLVKNFVFVLCKRFAKFFLNYWFVFFVFVPIGVFCFGRPLEVAYGTDVNLLRSFLKDMFGQQGLFSYNATWWFNAVILALWVMFPFLYLAMKTGFFSICVLIFLFFDPYVIMRVFHSIAFGLASYILPFALGIFIALRIDWINKVLNKVHPYVVLSLSLAVAPFLFFLRSYPLFPTFTGFSVDPFATLFLALAVVSLCRVFRCKFAFMQFVGKHSMNMYLTHTFIFAYFFHDFIYGFKYPILIFVALFASSLLLSVCIEFIKNRIGFYKLQGKVVGVIGRAGGLIPKEHDNAH